MNFIGSLDILGVRFRVVTREDATWPTGQQGLCDHGSATIALSDGMVSAVQRNTLLHEMVHAIAALQGLEMSEAEVSAIATGLATIPQLLIDPDPFPIQ